MITVNRWYAGGKRGGGRRRHHPTHDDITKTEGLHFGQKKSVVDRVKGLGKIKVDHINCVSLVHHARHRFLVDQQIGETGPTG